MSQYIISVIRTWVPIIVGAVLAKLIVLTGVVISEDASANLKNTLTLIVIGLYYAVARWLEQRYPRVGILLGYIKQPIYVTPTKRVSGNGFAEDSSFNPDEIPPKGEWLG
jgi:hypothetical protein